MHTSDAVGPLGSLKRLCTAFSAAAWRSRSSVVLTLSPPMNARWWKWSNICWRTQSTKNAALGSVTASVGGWMLSRVGRAMCES